VDEKTALTAPLEDLSAIIDEFAQFARPENSQSLIDRLCDITKVDPLRSFLQSTLPPIDLEEWKQLHDNGRRHSAIDLPPDTATRVATQLAICQAFAKKEIDLCDFTFQHFRVSKSSHDMLRQFGAEYLRPMLRDLKRIASQRPVSEALLNAIRSRPKSPDAILDGYLEEACQRIRDPAPRDHQIAIEKLWDAWERLKTTASSNNKQETIRGRIREVCPEPKMQELLHEESKLLTDFGNQFRVRHSEHGTTEFESPKHLDYWFHRMFAMLELLVK